MHSGDKSRSAFVIPSFVELVNKIYGDTKHYERDGATRTRPVLESLKGYVGETFALPKENVVPSRQGVI